MESSVLRHNLPMKTTLEIPDPVFRQAKARAAEQGIPLRQFVSDAVEKELKSNDDAAAKRKALLAMAGGLRHLRADHKRVRAILEKEFRKIEPEEWA